MSAEMRAFANHFMEGLKLGSGWAEKWQAQQIQKEHNKLLRDQHEAQDRIQQRRTDLYAQSVGANVELSRARAQAALRPKGGGGGAAAPAGSGLIDQLEAGAAGVGLSVPKAPAAPQGNVTNNYLQSDGESDPGVVSPPGMNKGGMVQKAAGGGSIEEGANMSIGQAMSYGSEKSSDKSSDKSKSSPLGGVASAIGAGAAKGALGGKEKPKAETVTPRGPVGSGVAGSYTEADSQPGGVLDTGIYRSGGKVRQFQSGGRVMRAIDTGTSGPGSGYGYRAAPPARST